MLGLDEARQLEWARQEKRDKIAEVRARALAEDIESNQVTVEPDGGVDISDAMAQMGRPMTSEQVIAKLKLCNSKLYFERAKSDPSKIGVYLLDPKGTVYVNPQGDVLVLKHICGMEAGVMPEFTVIHKTTKRVTNPELLGQNVGRDVPWKIIETYADQTRGWRTVLVRLLHAGLITRGDVDKHFGWVPSRDSERWANQTK